MKHIIAAGLIGAGIASGAWAQSSVTLYGSLDAGIAYISNTGGHAKWIEEQGNMQPDRWGLKSVEDLGGGLKTVVATGERLLYEHRRVCEERRAVEPAGLRGPEPNDVGTVTFGHQTPFSFDMLGPLSTGYQAASWYAFHPGNIDELADTGVVPYDNSAKFPSANFGGFTFGAMMGLGNTTDFSTGKSDGFGVTYANGPFTAAATYSNEHNRTPSIVTTRLSPLSRPAGRDLHRR